jgi:hypothetical protein
MNQIATQNQVEHDLSPKTSSASLILSGDAMERVFKFAEMMAKGQATVPRHLQGNPADCLAVTMQAAQWGMNPFAVAQKTHISPSGALGYEAQLISAVVTECGPVEGLPEYEYIGDWSKVLGKVEERKSDKGGKYYVATYTKKDEEGLGVRCKLKVIGEAEPRVMEIMMSQCYPRFSTQWATDPKQQISYVAIRKWARQNTPGVILGVNTPDELAEMPPKDMGAADVVAKQASAELIAQADAAAAGGKASYQKFWTNAGKDGRALLSDGHEARKEKAIAVDKARTVDQVAPPPSPATSASTAKPTDAPAPAFTYAQVMDRMLAAKDFDALNIAADLIGEVANGAQRIELKGKYDELLAAMEGNAS